MARVMSVSRYSGAPGEGRPWLPGSSRRDRPAEADPADRAPDPEASRRHGRSRLWDLLAFATLLVLTALLGRATILDGSSLALAWPAAGIAAAWCAVTGWRRALLVDLAVLTACTWLVNDLTGTTTGLGVALAVGTVVQVLIFGAVVSAWAPRMWGFGAVPPAGVRSMRDAGVLLGAAVIAAAAASLLGPAALLLGAEDGAQDGWAAIGAWTMRNATAILAIFPLSLLLRHAVCAPAAHRERTSLGRGRVLECVLLIVVTVVAFWLLFVVNDELPIVFLLFGTTVWAGIRFSSWVSDFHAIGVSAAVVAATLGGHGPYAAIDSTLTQQVVTQAYVALVVVLGLVLSVARREGLLLNHRLARAEAASAEQAAMLRAILDTMTDGVSVLDASGRVLLRNPAVVHLTGGLPLDAAGRVVTDTHPMRYADGTRVTRAGGPLARALAGEEVSDVELVLGAHPGADERRLVASARPLPGTEPPLVVLVFHDVTAARRERDELASFAGVVAHDLLNPVTVVEGWSETLLEQARAGVPTPPERQADQLERILLAARRMEHLITDLLAYTTAGELQIDPVPVDLGELVADVARARVDAASLEAATLEGESVPTIEVAADLPVVRAEPVLLRQVLDNLIGNAVKYVAEGTVPHVRVAARLLPDAPPGAPGPMVLLEVSDNGIGIPEEHRARVFDRFHRAHGDAAYRGTGLGLAIVKRVAERHGGTAWAQPDDATGGTTMCVTFPAAGVGSAVGAGVDAGAAYGT